MLTLLPGCTRLQLVLVRLADEDFTEGPTAMIRCHSASPARISPLRLNEARPRWARQFTTVGAEFLPGPPSPQGVKEYTVLWACRPAGPQQPLMWGYAVVPGVL